MLRNLFFCFLSVALFSCEQTDSAHQLRVDLRTDFAPGGEFDAVTVFFGRGEIQASFSHVADPRRSYVTGVALGDIRVDPGFHDVEVVLFRDGEPVVSRVASVIVDEPVTVVTVVITRDCAGVMCPGAGESALLESCLGGRCADPRCTVETPEFCPDGSCLVDTDCTLHSCGVPSCVTGACLYEADDSRCAADERCELASGCVEAGADAGAGDAGPDVTMPDAGVDAEMPDAGMLDVFDAGPLPGCPDVDDDTVFLYDFDSLSDLMSERAGATRGLANRPNDTSPCGGRVLNSGSSGAGRFVVDDAEDTRLTEGSIDFWIHRPSASLENEGVFSRDAQGTTFPGHLSLFLLASGRLVLRGQDVAATTHACSREIPEAQWVHIGINFGPDGIALFVDGERQLETGEFVLDGLPGVCHMSTPAFSIAGNQNPYVLGVGSQLSTEGSDAPVAAPALRWRFDHFRLSRVRRDYASEL